MNIFHVLGQSRGLSVSKILIRGWQSLRITSKFGLSFGLLLMIIVFEAVISYIALTSIWESNNAIIASADIQRLAMDTSRDWETIHRLRHDYFYQSPIIGAERAYERFALPAGGLIADVIRDGATLKQITSSPSSSDIIHESDTDLQSYLQNISQYATTFQEATDLELLLASEGTGYLSRLAQKSEELVGLLQNVDESASLLSIYYKMRYYEQVYLTTETSSALSSYGETILLLRMSIEKSTLQTAQKESALVALDEYQGLADKIIELETQIIEKRNLLDAAEDSIEPTIIELRAKITEEVIRIETQISQTRQTTTVLMVAGMVFGLVLATLIARLLNRSVTHNVTKLTQVASQLQRGNLNARASIDSADELGQLASTFNNMAQQLGTTIDRLELLRQASLDWTREHDVDKVVEIALDTAMCLSSADAGFIGLIEGEEIILVKAIGPYPQESLNAPLSFEYGILSRAICHRRTEILKDASNDPDDVCLIPTSRAKIAIPLLSAQRLIGVLNLEAQDTDCFAADTIEFLEICATGAAVAIHNTLLYAEAQRLAIEDPLTGLYNRRGLFELSQLEVNRIMRFRRPISALFIDVDYFKQFNDQYGYKIGDLVLRSVARSLQNNVRDIDLVSRYGGEEFVILLPELGQREAVTVAERIRKIVEDKYLETDEGNLVITISVGVATLTPESASTLAMAGEELQLLQKLIDEAGQMLQVAKAEGRNRVAVL